MYLFVITEPTVPKPNVAKRRQRALSTFADHSEQSAKKGSLQEMHDEIRSKCGATNRGLKPGTDRPIPVPKPQLIPEWKKLFNEFQGKLAAKKAKKDQLNATE